MGNVSLTNAKNLNELQTLKLNKKQERINHTAVGNHSVGFGVKARENNSINNLRKTNKHKKAKEMTKKDEIFIKSSENSRLSINPQLFKIIFPPPVESHLRKSYREKTNLRLSNNQNIIHSNYNKGHTFIDVVDESLL